MGRVKEHFHDEICDRANDEPWDQEPPDAEEFYREIELENAKEVLRRAAALGLVKEHGNESR